MSWTAPRTFTTGELVTAAMLNTNLRDNLSFLASGTFAGNADSRTFTNTSYADLDALTGGTGTIAAVAVSVATDTSARVTITANLDNTSTDITFLAYSVSGASTIASSDNFSLFNEGSASVQMSYTNVEDGLTAGTNVFELQARVTGNTGTLRRPQLSVEPLP